MIQLDGISRSYAGQTVLHELSAQSESLEEAFLQATAADQEYRSGGSLPSGPASPESPPTEG